MLWNVNAIKQSPSGNTTINFLIQANNDKSVRDFLGGYNLIILSLEAYKDSPEQYGNTLLSLSVGDKNITIVTNNKNPAEAVQNFVLAGFQVVAVNTKEKTLSETEVKSIISDAYNNKNKNLEQDQKNKELKIMKIEKKYSDEEKEKLDKIVLNTIEDVSLMIQYESQGVSQDLLNQLHGLDAELRKVKNSTNISTIVKTLEEIFILMEKIELEHIDTLKAHEIKIFENSEITNVDVKKELDSFKIAKVIQEAQTQQSPSDRYYNFMGISGIYNRFLTRDIKAKISNLANDLNGILEISKLITLMIMIILIVSLALLYIINKNYPEQILVYLIHLGSFGLSLYIIHSRRYNTLGYIIIQLILIVSLYFLITTLLTINFSLT